VIEAREACDAFFEAIKHGELSKRSVVRLQKPGWIEDILSIPLKRVADTIGAIAQKELDEQTEAELDSYRRRVLSYREGVSQTIDLEDDDQVYWVERTGKQGKTRR
jgi:hypothetical protein